jgi:hypothetical protein
MGYLYDISITALVIFSVAAQLISLPLIAAVSRSGAGVKRHAQL